MSPDCDIYCCHQAQKVMVGCMNTMLICQAVSTVVGRVKIGRTINKVMWHCQTHPGFIAQLPSMARQVSRALLQKWGKEHGKAQFCAITASANWPFDIQDPRQVTGQRHCLDCSLHSQTTYGPCDRCTSNNWGGSKHANQCSQFLV